jgi:hypothetical protein
MFLRATRRNSRYPFSKFAVFTQQIYMQIAGNRAMPLGKQISMTEDDRGAIYRWVSGRK